MITLFGFADNSYSQSVENSAANNLPLPSVLFAKHIEAIGGEKSLQVHTARTVNGDLIISAYGIKGNLSVVAEASNKMITTVDLGQFGTSRSGFNGTIGWSMDPMTGNKVLEGEALQEMIQNADYYGDNLHLSKGAIKQETVGTVTFEDGEHFRVLIVNDKGEESYLYFSKETGLMSGVDRMEFSAMGKVPTQVRMGNYVEFGGLKTASRISSSQKGVETIIEINSVVYADLLENAFELPSEIQDLTNK